MKKNKVIDDIVGVSEYDYFKRLYEEKGERLFRIKLEEVRFHEDLGFSLFYYYNKTKNISYYQIYRV